MTTFSGAPLRRLGRVFAAAALFGCSLAQAEITFGCVPPAYALLPVVNTGLPVVQVWTDNLAPVVDTENYVNGCMRIIDGSAVRYGAGLYNGTVQIRGRGNTTWQMPKKPYRLKLTTANPVLDMPAARDWVLLANYADKSLLRTNIAFELARRIGVPWMPRFRHADFYLNNVFLGSYQIGDRIEVAPNRVPIAKMSTTDVASPNVEGGYLLEVDYADRIDPEDAFFVAGTSGYHFVLQSPSGATTVQPQQIGYISAYVQGLEDAIFRGDFSAATGVPAYMDVDSLVSYYLVQELLKNKDAAMGSSVYMYKDRTGPLKMAPLWDFDISAGNIDFYQPAMYPEGWYLKTNAAWFDALMQIPEFKAAVKARWASFRPSLNTLSSYIDGQAKMLAKSQQKNFEVWPILSTYVWPNQWVTGSYSGEVSALKRWLSRRIAWIDANMANQ